VACDSPGLGSPQRAALVDITQRVAAFLRQAIFELGASNQNMGTGGHGQTQSSASAATLTFLTAELARDRHDMLAAGRSAANQIGFARAFGFRMVAAWWRALVSKDHWSQLLRELFPALEVSELAPSDAKMADANGEAIACFGPDVAADQIGLAYTSMLPRDHRAAHGIYYTPPLLVRRLIDQATIAGVDWSCARVLDPACGGGAFLAPVAHRIIEELRDCSPRILVENIATRLHGCELDPFGAWLSQVTLDAVLLPITREAGKRLPVVVNVCDSLRNTLPREHFDLVIGNPPYGRTRLDPAVRMLYRRSLYGHANQYGSSPTWLSGRPSAEGSSPMSLRQAFLPESISRI
jgi:adenine-specific DNA-methyltransferase